MSAIGEMNINVQKPDLNENKTKTQLSTNKYFFPSYFNHSSTCFDQIRSNKYMDNYQRY